MGHSVVIGVGLFALFCCGSISYGAYGATTEQATFPLDLLINMQSLGREDTNTQPEYLELSDQSLGGGGVHSRWSVNDVI